MTEQDSDSRENAAPEMPPELEIEFQDRKLWVRFPKPEQILVWRRTLRQLQGAEVQGWNGEQAMAALDRTRRIIDSLLVNPVDVTWLDDEMLDGRIDLRGAAEIVNKTIAAYAEAAEREKAEHGTRAERRAATKKTPRKAARKALAAGKKAAR